MSDVKKTIEAIRAQDESEEFSVRWDGEFCDFNAKDLHVLANLYEWHEERIEAVQKLLADDVGANALVPLLSSRGAGKSTLAKHFNILNAIRTIVNTTHSYPLDVAEGVLNPTTQE